jgi:beta-xylosidase
LFKDVFDGALNEGWEWIRENRFYWNLTDSPGNLTMFTYLGLINSPYFPKAQNLLVREAPTGNFELTTKMNLIPSSNFQHAGLLIYQSDDNFVQLIRQYCDDEGAGCVGDGIYFDNQELGNFKGGYFPTKVKFGDSTYLKLTFEAGSISGQGKTYTAYFSVDGENWITIGKHDNVLTPIYVGLIANGGIEQKIPCHFDYFTIANIL